MSYQGPITLIEEINNRVRLEVQDNVYKAVLKYGIQVDKDELIKALAYDRGQYDIGYKDGQMDALYSWWVVFPESLPKPGQDVLVLIWDEHGNKYKYAIDTYCGKNAAFEPTFLIHEAAIVKYWHPLPEMPDKERKHIVCR